jgi:hypothetical protein
MDPAVQQPYIDDLANVIVPQVADNLAARGRGWVWKLTKLTGTLIVSRVAKDLAMEYGPIVKERATEYGTEAAQWVVEQGARAVEYFFTKEGELVNSDVIYKESQRSPVMLKLKDSTITKETFRFLEEPETAEAFVAEHDVDGPSFWKESVLSIAVPACMLWVFRANVVPAIDPIRPLDRERSHCPRHSWRGKRKLSMQRFRPKLAPG